MEPDPERRYFTNNPSYGHGDGSILQAFLRHLRPARYLEVGSGWTTALALDTNDRYLDGRLRLTCIEPYPDDLSRLIRPGDDVEIIVSPVQDVDLARFKELESGDILFIDCSHVVKTGSDAHYLITRVLPVVPSGVYIHIHDMFWPFEYPRSWIEEGRVWTEAYLLHAFLLVQSRVRDRSSSTTGWPRELPTCGQPGARAGLRCRRCAVAAPPLSTSVSSR